MRRLLVIGALAFCGACSSESAPVPDAADSYAGDRELCKLSCTNRERCVEILDPDYNKTEWELCRQQCDYSGYTFCDPYEKCRAESSCIIIAEGGCDHLMAECEGACFAPAGIFTATVYELGPNTCSGTVPQVGNIVNVEIDSLTFTCGQTVTWTEETTEEDCTTSCEWSLTLDSQGRGQGKAVCDLENCGPDFKCAYQIKFAQ